MEAFQATVKVDRRERILLYCVSFFIPIIGLAISYHYYYKKDQEFKRLGSVCATCCCLGILFYTFGWILGDTILRLLGSIL